MLRMTPAKFKKLRPKYRVALVGALFANFALSVVCVYLFGRWLRGHPWYTPNVTRKRPAQRSYLGRSDHEPCLSPFKSVGGAAFLAFLTWCWAKFLRWPREQARRVFFHSEFRKTGSALAGGAGGRVRQLVVKGALAGARHARTRVQSLELLDRSRFSRGENCGGGRNRMRTPRLRRVSSRPIESCSPAWLASPPTLTHPLADAENTCTNLYQGPAHGDTRGSSASSTSRSPVVASDLGHRLP